MHTQFRLRSIIFVKTFFWKDKYEKSRFLNLACFPRFYSSQELWTLGSSLGSKWSWGGTGVEFRESLGSLELGRLLSHIMHITQNKRIAACCEINACLMGFFWKYLSRLYPRLMKQGHDSVVSSASDFLAVSPSHP